MDKRIFVVFAVFLIAVIGCAYAADSTGDVVTISDVNFTIPDGFTEDIDSAVVNESGSDDGYNYVTNSKTFENEDNLLMISVAEYDQDITDDLIEDLGDEATINNITGYSEDLGFLALFSYVQDGKVVVITANDMNIIEEVLS